MSPRLRCRSVTRVLASGEARLKVLDQVDLAIEAGEFVAILGPSGSGKSTLLGLLAGLDRATSGSIELDGQDLGALDEDGLARLRRERIGFVFQNFQLLPNLTARENVLVPMELLGRPDAGARADELLAAVGLTERGHHYPAQLSGGEQQRVALARAFSGHPDLLLADEPTGNLDAESGEMVLALLEELQQREGVTLVLVTHDPGVAARVDRRLYLAAGKLVREERGRAAAGA